MGYSLLAKGKLLWDFSLKLTRKVQIFGTFPQQFTRKITFLQDILTFFNILQQRATIFQMLIYLFSHKRLPLTVNSQFFAL